jgi:hypothetical protein
MAHAVGVEPTFTVLETGVLPLYETCTLKCYAALPSYLYRGAGSDVTHNTLQPIGDFFIWLLAI